MLSIHQQMNVRIDPIQEVAVGVFVGAEKEKWHECRNDPQFCPARDLRFRLPSEKPAGNFKGDI